MTVEERNPIHTPEKEKYHTLEDIHRVHDRYIDKIINYRLYNFFHFKDIKQEIYLKMGLELQRKPVTETDVALSTFVHKHASWACSKYITMQKHPSNTFLSGADITEYAMSPKYVVYNDFAHLDEGLIISFLEPFIRKLSGREQEVLWWRVIKGLEFQIIAERLGISIANAFDAHVRAIRRLQTMLSHKGIDYERFLGAL